MSRVEPGPGRTDAAAARLGRKGELVPRVASALVMAVAAVVAAWIGGTAFEVFWLAAGLAILWEWQRLVGPREGMRALGPGAVALTAAAILAARGMPGQGVAALALGAAGAAFLAAPGRRAVSAGGALYAGALVIAVLLLRQSARDGFEAIVWLFAVVWGTDTFAFFGGRLIGGARLAPSVSPSKTWSGFGVGVASGALLGLLVAPRTECGLCTLAAGLATGVAAQAGDLFESALKRRFGAKDAGALIPGHGGVMDRLDGFIAAAVLAAVVGSWRFGPGGAGAGMLRW